MSAAAWQAVAAWVTAAIYLAILVFAWRQVAEARRLREAESRLFVVIDFDVFARPPLIYLTIANRGKTLARNVRLRFDPQLSSATFGEALSELRLLTEGMPALAPGRTIPILYENALDLTDERGGAYLVRVTYEGEEGRRYEHTIPLDLGVYWNWHYIRQRGINDVHDRLEELVAVLKGWSVVEGRGLLRLSPDEVRERAGEERRRREERRGQRPPEADQ